MSQITLVAELDGETSHRAAFEVRAIASVDLEELGRLYFESYDPGVACDTIAEAIEDIQASFDGDYGRLLWEASLVAVDDGRLIGAVMTVDRPPWEGLPDCPMIIELFVDRDHRSRGIGRGLVRRSMGVLRATGERRVSLRVDPANEPAMRLYQSLGFGEWPEDGKQTS